jgi:anti-sigma-K factor RskA
MSDMVENGSSGGARPLSPSESHDEFLELCALASTDLLSVSERRRLDEHLRECSICREAVAQYQSLADAGIPAASIDSDEDFASQPTNGWSPGQAEAAFFARLDREEQETAFHPSDVPSTQPEPPKGLRMPARVREGSGYGFWRQMWWQYAAGAILLIALGLSLYRSGIHRGTEMAKEIAPAINLPTSATDARMAGDTKPLAAPQRVPNRGDEAQNAALREQIAGRIADIASLQREKSALERNLRSSQERQDQLRENTDDVNQQLTAARSELEAVKQRLEAASGQNSQDTVKLVALQHQIDELNNSLAQRDQEVAREQELLGHDQDIRELMGSRNLYIAEVYDVAKTGDTERPFGRVFYTKGKSLIFYAYDLDQQHGLRDASTFQAWGRRGPDQAHAVNLGILYVDNAAKKRWVLKADDPKNLADIDAVFVTVEPHGGSSRPSGKPLLFAYLRIEPNHP